MATKRDEQRERTRQRIIEAAADAFAEGGAKNAGLIGIGQRVGISHAAVLYHFGSAHELQVAVLNERDRRFLEEVVGSSWDGGGLGALLNLPRAAQFSLDHPALAKLFSVLEAESFDAGQPLHQYFVDRRRVVHDLLLAMLRAGIEAGDIRDDLDVEALAHEVLAFQTGAHIQWALDPERVDLLKIYEAYTEALRARVTPTRTRRPRAKP